MVYGESGGFQRGFSVFYGKMGYKQSLSKMKAHYGQAVLKKHFAHRLCGQTLNIIDGLAPCFGTKGPAYGK
jgi:hypothetical protein